MLKIDIVEKLLATGEELTESQLMKKTKADLEEMLKIRLEGAIEAAGVHIGVIAEDTVDEAATWVSKLPLWIRMILIAVLVLFAAIAYLFL